MGVTTPVVPRIDIPPTMPSLALSVRFAIASPSGTNTSTCTPFSIRCFSRTSSTASWIIRRGPGLMAGSPGGSSSPGRVIVPTPVPPVIIMFSVSSKSQTLAPISARLVTSGSSPASFMTVHEAYCLLRASFPVRHLYTGISIHSSVNSRMGTADGASIPAITRRAALAAAAAAAPVVNPERRRLFLVNLLMPPHNTPPPQQ